ncbi:hypothetical protein CHARACLAT_002536 [Characodon lateralis]|uniref:Uncharacterized protein n=1 Tax=Characodon lateralis TaxID=208331 RepID=A0ABU7CY68_9TELE|nr:hypothetical protein [Characodon lateralis]
MGTHPARGPWSAERTRGRCPNIPLSPALDTTASGATHCQSRLTIRPMAAAPACMSMRKKHVTATLPGRVDQLPQAKHNPQATPVQVQNVPHSSTHPNMSPVPEHEPTRSPVPGWVPAPQKEAPAEGHHSTSKTSHPATQRRPHN